MSRKRESSGDDPEQLTRHHIICRSKNGTDENSNILIVKRKYHAAFHFLFGNMLPEEIIEYLKEKWFQSNV